MVLSFQTMVLSSKNSASLDYVNKGCLRTGIAYCLEPHQSVHFFARASVYLLTFFLIFLPVGVDLLEEVLAQHQRTIILCTFIIAAVFLGLSAL